MDDCYCKIKNIRNYISDFNIADDAEVWVQAPQAVTRKWLNQRNYPDSHIKELTDPACPGYSTFYIRAWGPMVFKKDRKNFYISIDY
jgi:hypothetical protein